MAVKNSGGDAVVKSVQVMGAHAVILPLVIYAGLEVSGSHFNPMVTACFVLAGKLVSHGRLFCEPNTHQTLFKKRNGVYKKFLRPSCCAWHGSGYVCALTSI